MMDSGWRYTDVIEAQYRQVKNPMTRRISFEKDVWHGKHLDTPVVFFHTASVNANWDIIANNLAKKALKAWDDYTDSVPYYSPAGEVKLNPVATKMAFMDEEENLV